MPRRFNRRQRAQNRAFLAALARTGNVRLAARMLGVHRATYFKRRARCPVFAAAWDAALAAAQARLAGSSPGPPGEGLRTEAFTGDNVRLHLRGSYIHVVKPEWGLSAQLRGRWFRSSDPGEFDYYSPRWYAELLPVAQLRRFVDGWELVGAAGLGVQRDSATDWRQARYAHARFRSPAGSAWRAHGALTYTNTPSISALSDQGYSYVQFTLGLSRTF